MFSSSECKNKLLSATNGSELIFKEKELNDVLLKLIFSQIFVISF